MLYTLKLRQEILNGKTKKAAADIKKCRFLSSHTLKEFEENIKKNRFFSEEKENKRPSL